ncbi:MAG: LacI family DNA-binding transcriptional regulator [Lachnotalea sp.]
MVTIKDIADMLGISTTTVSNVIHGKTGEVSQKTVERVQKLVQEYNYVPNINARNLAQNKSKIIGVAIKASHFKYENIISDPFFAELIGAIEAEVRSKGYFMMIYISATIEEIIQYVSTWNVDGLILVGMIHDDYIKMKWRYKKPTVLIDSYLPEGITKYVNIGLDDEVGSYNMTKYLLENGHHKIGFVADNMEGVDYYRYMGHKKALQDNKILVEEENLMIVPQGHQEEKAILKEFYEKIGSLTAFMFCSDYYATIVLNYLTDRGVKVPDDISITGYDNNHFSKVVRPALTTVGQDVTKKGSQAVSYLIKMINGQPIKQLDIKLPTELVIRSTVRKI